MINIILAYNLNGTLVSHEEILRASSASESNGKVHK